MPIRSLRLPHTGENRRCTCGGLAFEVLNVQRVARHTLHIITLAHGIIQECMQSCHIYGYGEIRRGFQEENTHDNIHLRFTNIIRLSSS